MQTGFPLVFSLRDPGGDGVAVHVIDLGDVSDRHLLSTEQKTMGARTGARGGIIFHDVFE